MKRTHLLQKRDEIIWSLINQQDYNLADVGTIFNIDRSTVLRINNKKPVGWKSPWHKYV